MKLRLKEDVIEGLVSGKLYTMALHNLYYKTRSDSQLELQLASNLQRGGRLTLWEIIKILSRKGIYVAQPSDMKLTEGTLRQRKPLRIVKKSSFYYIPIFKLFTKILVQSYF